MVTEYLMQQLMAVGTLWSCQGFLWN